MRNIFNLFGLGKAYPFFEAICELFTLFYNIAAGFTGWLLRIIKALFSFFERKEKPLIIDGKIVPPPAGK